MSSLLTNITRTTEYASAKRVKYELQLLDKAMARLIFDKWAAKKGVDLGNGTVRYNKLLRTDKKTTPDVEGTLYGMSDAKKLYTNYKDVTPTEYGDSFAFTDDVMVEAFIKDEDNQAEIADQYARSMNYLMAKAIAQGGMRHRIDKDSTYQVSGTIDAGSSATAAIDAGLTQADDFWNGGVMTIINPDGQGYDESSAVTDFVASSDTATVAFTNTIDTTSNYRMTVGTGLAATDVISTTALLDVRLLHSELETETFKGGVLRSILHPRQERDLWNDTLWQNRAIYDDSGRFQNYELYRFAGIEFLIGSETYREDADGTENQSTGVVFVTPVFGQKSYDAFRWGDKGASDAFMPEWIYKTDADSSDLRNKFKAISWKTKVSFTVLRATSIVNLMTGATDSGMLVL